MATIESIEAIPATMPDMFGEPLHLCLVRVQADGLIGWGEICDSYCCTFPELYLPLIEKVYGPLVIGHDLAAVDGLTRRVRTWARRRIGDSGLAVQALSGLELALWDLYGKAQGRPVSQLLGHLRDHVPLYASGKFLDEPLDMHVETLGPAFDHGVRTAKVRASLDPDADLDVLAELRTALPTTVALLVDGNEHFSVPTALRFAEALRDHGVIALEEPVPQVFRRAIARLSQQAPLPIAYGEHLFGVSEFGDALAAGWPDIVQPDPSITGGLSECLQIATLAEAEGVPVMPHSAAGPVSLAACLHLGAARQNVQLVEHAFTLEPLWETIMGTGFSRSAITDGALPVPTEPGWGIEIDESALRAHPYQPRTYDVSLTRRSIGVL